MDQLFTCILFFLPSFVTAALVDYFNKFYVYQEKVTSRFTNQLSAINNAQIVPEIPFFWSQLVDFSVGF